MQKGRCPNRFAVAPRFRPDRPSTSPPSGRHRWRREVAWGARRAGPHIGRGDVSQSVGSSRLHTGAAGRKAAGGTYVVSILRKRKAKDVPKSRPADRRRRRVGACLPWRSRRCRRCRFLHYQCRKARRRNGQPAPPMCTNSAVPTCRIRCAYWHACRPIGRRSARLATGCWSATASEPGRGWRLPVPRIRCLPIRTCAFL